MSEIKKDIYLSTPALIHMKIYDDGGGSFSLDDHVGWRWSGDDDEFLLGILRVGSSSMSKEFFDELEKSNITKEEIKRAIHHSLNKQSNDGLYHLIGDNNAYKDFQGLGDAEYSDESYEIESCLKRNFYEEKKAERIARDIIDKSFSDMPSSEDIFEEYENELRDNFGVDRTWGQFVEEGVKKCNTHKTAKDFMSCIFDHMNDEKEGVQEGFFEKFNEAVHGAMKISDDDLKEIAEQNEVPFKVIDHCTHGGYEVLEEFRPIKESQSFLESFGADVNEK